MSELSPIVGFMRLHRVLSPSFRPRRRFMPRGTVTGNGHPIVSLTFDDGLASQRLASELLEGRGLRGTFYVPSGLVGSRGHLGWDDIIRLAEQGHEVGGHTHTESPRTRSKDSSATRAI